jgi:hypothetical protein
MTATPDDGWELLFDLLDNGWPGDFTPDAAKAMRLLLGDVDFERVLSGLQRLLYAGARFRPSAAEILAEARRDPSAPTFDEALVLLFRRGGILDVRVKGTTDTNPRYRAELYEKVAERLADRHPLIGGFVARLGVERLRSMDVDDPEQGHWRRKELRETWDDFVDAQDGREVAALAAGTGRRRLVQLDPLAALGIGREPAQLGAGEGS